MKSESGGPSVWEAFRYLRPYKAQIAVGIALLLVTNALDKAVPLLLRDGIDAFHGGEWELAKKMALVVLGVAALMWMVRTSSRVLIFNAGRDVEFDLRNQFLAHIHKLGPRFFRTFATGDIMSRATSDLNQVRLLVGFGVLQSINALFAYVVCLPLMVSISGELTLWALSPYPLFVITTWVFSRLLYRFSQGAQKALAALAEKTHEQLAGLRLIRAYGIEPEMEVHFEVANQDALDRNMKLAILQGVMWPFLMGITSAALLVAIGVGGKMVLHDELTVGEFAAFNAYLGQLIWPTLAFGFILSVLQRGRAGYTRVREVLDFESEHLDGDKLFSEGARGEIEVRNLNFEIDGQPVLREISFHLPAEKTLAVVGTTGSGRSTLAALLPRILDTPRGSVFVDGQDVCDLKLEELRRRVAYGAQVPFLFSTTIERNIAFGYEHPQKLTANELSSVARQAAVDDEIRGLAKGYQTLVGERGVQLSGGQKQRVALARSLLLEPSVLILDDPLSAVDAGTEQTILRALEEMRVGRTMVLVTNRVVAAKLSDEILVMDEGRIVQRGTHDELSQAPGFYGALCARQQIEAELAEWGSDG